MSEQPSAPGHAPRGTPGYTGVYQVHGDMLMAMRPDGTWAPVRRYQDFPSKTALDSARGTQRP